jgi:mycothiol synthase
VFGAYRGWPASRLSPPNGVAPAGTVGSVADLNTRSYEPGDAAAVTALMNAIDEVGGGRAGFAVQDVSAMLAATVAHFATDSRLTFAPDGTLVAMGTVPTPPPGGFRVDLFFGGVHPGWRGRGLGRAILGWQYERAAQIHAAGAPQPQWQAETMTVTGEPTATALFTRLGFTAARYSFEMLAPTTATTSATLPAGLRSEPPTPGIERPLYEAHMEAFADHWGHQRREYDKWLPVTVRSDGFRPDLSRVAFDGDEIAGFVLSYRDHDPSRISVGQVGTRRSWRGRGVAGALLAEVIEASALAGFPYLGLEVDADSPTGAVGVYERAGFRQEHSFVTYRCPIG